jgi:hypothetical protein
MMLPLVHLMLSPVLVAVRWECLAHLPHSLFFVPDEYFGVTKQVL